MTNVRFHAPWGRALRVMSLIGSAICLGASGLSFFSMNRAPVSGFMPAAVACIPLSILAIAAFFTVRGFEISAHTLWIHRLGWATRVSLERLVSVERDPTAMNGSIRTWGNGGFFSFSGRFRNHKLGAYRAYVTDANNSVVIRSADGVTVVSPESPDAFVNAVKALEAVRSSANPENIFPK
jgi:hypothetical protein